MLCGRRKNMNARALTRTYTEQLCWSIKNDKHLANSLPVNKHENGRFFTNEYYSVLYDYFMTQCKQFPIKSNEHGQDREGGLEEKSRDEEWENASETCSMNTHKNHTLMANVW